MCVLEDSPSGLWRTLGKRVGCKPSGVRIPHPPRLPRHPLGGGTFVFPNRLCVVACVNWGAILRVTVSSEPPQGRKAARIRVRCRVRGGSFYFPLIFRGLIGLMAKMCVWARRVVACFIVRPSLCGCVGSRLGRRGCSRWRCRSRSGRLGRWWLGVGVVGWCCGGDVSAR